MAPINKGRFAPCMGSLKNNLDMTVLLLTHSLIPWTRYRCKVHA